MIYTILNILHQKNETYFPQEHDESNIVGLASLFRICIGRYHKIIKFWMVTVLIDGTGVSFTHDNSLYIYCIDKSI